jgi:hypothetical protein
MTLTSIADDRLPFSKSTCSFMSPSFSTSFLNTDKKHDDKTAANAGTSIDWTTEMTALAVRRVCIERGLYEHCELNETLFLQHK